MLRRSWRQAAPETGVLAILNIGLFPIIMGVTLVSATAIVLGNLLADLITPFIDPRIRLR